MMKLVLGKALVIVKIKSYSWPHLVRHRTEEILISVPAELFSALECDRQHFLSFTVTLFSKLKVALCINGTFKWISSKTSNIDLRMEYILLPVYLFLTKCWNKKMTLLSL